MGSSATIAFVPRETVSNTVRSLTSIVERTRGDFELVCIAAGYPQTIVADVERLAARRNGRVLRFDTYLTPNQARNRALAAVTTPYVVFVDNDVMVTPEWLERLVTAAESSGAMIVAPLVYELEPEGRHIHMAGGEARVVPVPGKGPRYHERHRLAHQDIEKLKARPERTETELVEFHTVLVDMRVFRNLGPLDERLLSVAEHWDLCLAVRNQGGRVLLEPASEVTYIPPITLTDGDQRFFNLRWSFEWLEPSLARLAEKHRLAPRDNGLEKIRAWVRQHRLHQYSRAHGFCRGLAGRRLGYSLFKRTAGPYDRLVNRWRVGDDYRRWSAFRNAERTGDSR